MSPEEPAITSALPSPSTSATAGALGSCQPSTGIGYDGSQSPPAASQPPSTCSKGTGVAGEDWAAARRESTTPPKSFSEPPGEVRPNAALAPSARTLGLVAGDPGPVPVTAKCLCPPAPPRR